MVYPFYIVDVFAVEKYTGNQLAVFSDAREMTASQMQDFAKEINFSETTFINPEPDRDQAYKVRIFTPNQELPFAGHPTLGTAFIIREFLQAKTAENQTITLRLNVGQIPVRCEVSAEDDPIFWMLQNQPEFGERVSAETVASVLNITPEEINPNLPIQEVSTGIYFLVVPINSLETLKKIKVNLEAYYQLIASLQAKSILVFCPETYSEENDLCVRVFADYLGIPEDPATGSANGCLAAYLVSNQSFLNQKGNLTVKVEQGYEINRPSRLFLKANPSQIEIGGKVKLIAQGSFLNS